MSAFLDILLLLALLIGSAIGTYLTGKKIGLSKNLCLAIFLWHTIFCIYYWHYAESNVADANSYYRHALHGEYDWSPGSSFVKSFTTILASALGFNKVCAFLVYNGFGVAGLLLLAHIVVLNWPDSRGWRRHVPYLILFLPGLSFWSSAIGKDAPAFFAACLATYAYLDIRGRKLSLSIAILLMFVVRPHVAGFMMAATGLALASGKQINLLNRILLISVVVASGIASFSFIAGYVGFEEEVSAESVDEIINRRSELNLDGGSSVEISAMPFPLKLFTYLFRPLFFDASSLMGVAASFENFFLLSLFMAFLVRGFIPLLRIGHVSVRYNIAFFCIGLVAFSLTTANLGIAVRQKIMILPALFFLIVVVANRVLKKISVNEINGTGDGGGPSFLDSP